MQYSVIFFRSKLLLLFFVLLGFQLAGAQDMYEQEFSIDLSNPNQPGKLKVGLHNGAITVEGHSGKNVLIQVAVYDKDAHEQRSKEREGLKRIPNFGSEFEIYEEDNVVRIKGGHRGQTNYKVKVPQKFSLYIDTHHNGEVKVSNVNGEMEINSHHGGIELDRISGSVIADTHHGEITASFVSITPDVPMAFSTYHGDVDVTFPSGTNGSAKVKSSKGDIYTDFEMDLKMQDPELSTEKDGHRRIRIGGWLYGKIGKGGPEFRFQTYHGDVILRRK